MPLAWRSARLHSSSSQTPTARSLHFAVPGWPGHLAGQHVDVRLTADDGYQAVRSYSLAAPADGDCIELGVQAVIGGEVSPYLADQLSVGAEVEIRGPLGNWFVWRPDQTGSVLLVAGGSGIVPLTAMIRARRQAQPETPFHLLYSARTPQDIWYGNELTNVVTGLEVEFLYTRQAPPDNSRGPGRLKRTDLERPLARLTHTCLVYVCGPTGFVETAANLLVDLGQDPATIRTERFG
ncbi:ferredoxin reductase [Streptomyces sp. NPDC005281]|uniref:ferredoxin reductase n=1 Tax=Streptomyces sp. NPDC005281 TaxID=3155712 RepID=UPI0033A3F5E3